MNDIEIKQIKIESCDSPKSVIIYTHDNKHHQYDVIGYGTYNVVIASHNIIMKLPRIPSSHIPDDALCDYVYGNLMHANAAVGYPVNPFLFQTLITLGSTISLASERQHMSLEKYIKSTPSYIRGLNTKIIIETLAHALYLLKKSRILHRDIKPGNILINMTNDIITSVYLIDFGIATTTYRSDPLSESVTEWYRAPEIATVEEQPSKTYTYPSDTWSAGVTLYEYIHGAPMFKSRNNKHLIELHNAPWPEIPDSPYKHIIEKMIVLDPSARITPDQLLLALDLQVLPVYPIGHNSIIKIRTYLSQEYKPFFNAAKLLKINTNSKLFNYALSAYMKLVAIEGHSYVNAATTLLLGLKLVSFDNHVYIDYIPKLPSQLQLNDVSLEELIENEIRIVQLISPFIDLSAISIGRASLTQ